MKLVSKKLVYYNIPKCASMWMRHYLGELVLDDDAWTGTKFTDEPLDDYQKIIVLRDPVARWLSHCPAAAKITSLTANSVECDVFFRDLHTFLADEHMAPQIDFIRGLDLSKVFWFKTDADLSARMTHFVRTHITDQTPVPDPINESPNDDLFRTAVDTWKEMLKVPRYLARLHELYREDYKLIDSVRFYDYQ